MDPSMWSYKDTSSVWRSLQSPSDCCWIGSRQGNAKTRLDFKVIPLRCGLEQCPSSPFSPVFSFYVARRILSIVIAYFGHLVESKCRGKYDYYHCLQ